MKNIYLFILFALLLSCGINMGDRIDNENVSVYYLEGIDREKAIIFARYWKNQNLVGERKQNIQLEKDENIILVKLIEREKYQNEGITINEEALLQQLERDLKRDVFGTETQIVITDNTFRPILKR